MTLIEKELEVKKSIKLWIRETEFNLFYKYSFCSSRISRHQTPELYLLYKVIDFQDIF